MVLFYNYLFINFIMMLICILLLLAIIVVLFELITNFIGNLQNRATMLAAPVISLKSKSLLKSKTMVTRKVIDRSELDIITIKYWKLKWRGVWGGIWSFYLAWWKTISWRALNFIPLSWNCLSSRVPALKQTESDACSARSFIFNHLFNK